MDPADPAPSLLRRAARFLWGYDFFVSYQWASGGSYAVNLAERLRDRGYDCFLDRSEFAAGDDWRNQAQQALRHTSRLVIIATRDAVIRSPPVRHELEVFTGRSDRVIPIVFGERFSDAERQTVPTLKLIPPSTVDIVEDREQLERGPSERALDELVQAHRLVRRRSVRAAIVSVALVVLATAALVALGFWRSAESARQEEQRQRQAAQEAFLESQTTLAHNFVERGMTAIRESGQGPGLRFLLRAYEIAKRVGLPPEAGYAEDVELGRSVRRLMAGRGSAVGLPLVHEAQLGGTALGPGGRLVRTLTLNYDGEPQAYRFWDAETGRALNEGLRVDDFHFDISMSTDWSSALHWSGRSFEHLDVASGASRTVATEGLGEVSASREVRFSASARRLALVEPGGLVSLWNAETGELAHRVETGLEDVDVLEFTENGATLLAVDRTPPSFVTIDVPTASADPPMSGSGNSFGFWRVTPDGRRVVTVDDDEEIRLWSATGGSSVPLWSTVAADKSVLRISPDGSTILVFDGLGAILLDAESGRPLSRPWEFPRPGDSVFSPDSRWVATVVRLSDKGEKHLLDVWDARTGEERWQTPVFSGSVPAVRFSPDSALLLVADDSTLRLLDAENGDRRGGPWPSPDGYLLSAFTVDGGTIRWLDPGSRIATVHEATVPESVLSLPSDVRGARLSPDGARLLTTSDGMLRLWDVGSGTVLGEPLQIPERLGDIRFSPDGKQVRAEGPRSSFLVWGSAAELDRAATQIDGPERGFVSLMPGGDLVADSGGVLYLWSSDEGWLEIASLDGLEEVSVMELAPDRGRLAANGYFGSAGQASSDGNVWVWDLVERRLVTTIDPTSGVVQNIEEPERLMRILFTPDGERLMTASTYGTIRLWDVASGDLLRGFALPGEPSFPGALTVSAAAFSPDASVLAVIFDDELVRLWDVPTGHLIEEYGAHGFNREIESLVFAADGRSLLSAAEDGVYRRTLPELPDDLDAVSAWVETRARSEG